MSGFVRLLMLGSAVFLTSHLSACSPQKEGEVKNDTASEVQSVEATKLVAEKKAKVEAVTIENIFESIDHDPTMLRLLLKDMPKGGDLHNHAVGTSYAEEFLEWAGDRDYCINSLELAIQPPPCVQEGSETAKGLMQRKPQLYSDMVDALSVREQKSGVDNGETGHAQFFGSFGRFMSITQVESGRVLASVRSAGALDNVLYQELMFNPPVMDSYAFAVQDPDWKDGEFDTAFSRFEPELKNLVDTSVKLVDEAEAKSLELMRCGTEDALAGCEVETRYNCYGLRLMPPPNLFRHLAQCFALIETDPRYVGVSLVQPEDDPNALVHYDQHMEMVAFFKKKFPSARISLHAGELTLGIVPPSDLTGNIEKAVKIAGSERIGHGVDIAYEANAHETLKYMAENEITVEINISSNDIILGVTGEDHPLNLYRRYGVPFVLSTDDQGVLRSDMTEQYIRAVLEHGLDYSDLKEASFNAAHYAFLPGETVWADDVLGDMVDACSSLDSEACSEFQFKNPKAVLELRLLEAFKVYEANVLDKF